MSGDVLAHGTVGELIGQIEGIEDPEHGMYVLYAPAEITTISEVMEAAIILESAWQEENDPLPEFAIEHGLEPACEIYLAQDVMVNAKMQRPNVNISGLIFALNYFLDHDAFLDFDVYDYGLCV